MANPTTNFGWIMPTSTDLVTDLPADFAVFGQGVDTTMAELKGGTTGQILSKTSNTDMDFVWVTNDVGDITAVNTTAPLQGGATSGAVTLSIYAATTSVVGAVQLEDSTASTSTTKAATPNSVKSAYDLANGAIAKTTVTTAGDIIYRNATVPTRLGIGTAGQVLKVNAGATAPEWGAATASQSFTQLNASSLTGTTYTVSGLSGYNTLAIYYSNAVSNGGNITIRLNTDTGANYNYYGGGFVGATTWASSNIRRVDNTASTSITVIGNATANANGIGMTIFGANGTGPKQFVVNSGTGNGPIQYNMSGFYSGTSVISSISIIGAASFTGTVEIYGA